jgi:hypothetical protein
MHLRQGFGRQSPNQQNSSQLAILQELKSHWFELASLTKVILPLTIGFSFSIS